MDRDTGGLLVHIVFFGFKMIVLAATCGVVYCAVALPRWLGIAGGWVTIIWHMAVGIVATPLILFQVGWIFTGLYRIMTGRGFFGF